MRGIDDYIDGLPAQIIRKLIRAAEPADADLALARFGCARLFNKRKDRLESQWSGS